MNFINKLAQRFIYTLYRPVKWKRSSHENYEHWKGIKVGDIVEAAVECPNGIRYRVEELYESSMEARIVRLDNKGEPQEHYTLSLRMIRPVSHTS
ncbi:MAG: hypothetical protein RML40_06705 [Bacteroidota bacterium]|nr:hypothetical protein [Candidatus Kapabacteria bacterium]MDW8220206.1 hypothetical protein [Bacteroidota bacterium]